MFWIPPAIIKASARRAAVWFVLSGASLLAGVGTGGAVETLTPRRWLVEGTMREALVYAPATARTNPAPVVFAFHGHGGSMRQAARMFRYHTHWPEAIVVYPQGLNTPGRLTDPAGRRSGWQSAVGEQDDRDLKFFDAICADLTTEFSVDAQRVYATGHSNGGGFVYVLWAARGDRLTAVAPSAAVAGRSLPALTPKPVLQVAGRHDELVNFAWQQRTLNQLRRLNQCGEGKPWPGEMHCTLYPSSQGTPVVAFLHPGAHRFPPAAPALIVKFFQTIRPPTMPSRLSVPSAVPATSEPTSP